MFQAVKGFIKEDLKLTVEEIGETVPQNATMVRLKDIILNSKEYSENPEFVKEILITTIYERRQQADRLYEENIRKENHELELAKIKAMGNQQIPFSLLDDINVTKRKFTLPRLEFRQFNGDIKEWLPFWSQFEKIDKDNDIAQEDKFQYLIQATVAGSRAREVIESFPPTSANYAKAIESLRTRFGREDLLVEVYVRELLKLIISVQTKEAFSLTVLYDKLEAYLRALETLGVTTDKCASILYPMVESCFPAEFLKAWNRSNVSNEKSDAQERLNNLMQFLKAEVEGEERINLAVAGFGLGKCQDRKLVRKEKFSTYHEQNKRSTAAGLLTMNSTSDRKTFCIFCEGTHKSIDCFKAQSMTLTEKQNIVKTKKCCYACLTPGHTVKKCRIFLRCLICSKRHVPLMCEALERKRSTDQEKLEKPPNSGEVNLTNFNKRSPKVFLQTLQAKLFCGNKEKVVRLLFDSASHKSYILKETVEDMDYEPIRQEKLVHSLFGGVSTQEIIHNCYRIRLKDLNDTFRCNFEVLDQINICGKIQTVCEGTWLKELRENNIFLNDVSDSCEDIHILIGADIMGKLLTGRRKVLSMGLVAMETSLGWTLMGKVPHEESSNHNLAMAVTTLFVNEADISDLWRLDLIGIKDPVEKKSKCEVDIKTKEDFLKTVKVNKNGRYEVCLPWAEDKAPLPDNVICLAKRRLNYTTTKLIEKGLFQKYEAIFLSWLDERIIEEVPLADIYSYGNYLHHHPVIKLSSNTTPMCLVCDASARLTGYPSLNQCLELGPNLIELIPDILFRFREKKLGISWDEEITGELRAEFISWFEDLKHLEDIEIPRFIQVSAESFRNCILHTFVDGSKEAYAAVTFLRVDEKNKVQMFLLGAKSRVSPLKSTTIPRMELLAAVIGTRLATSIVESLGWTTMEKYFWSDSTTVIAWIQRNENWSVFVRNRVEEIRKLSKSTSWRHIPGVKNPADLPSRGCKSKYLVSSKWWEGPQWMKDPTEYQYYMESSNYGWNEEEVEKERAKGSSSLATIENINDSNWYYRYFYNYGNIVRLVGWIMRFKYNSMYRGNRLRGELTKKEFQAAELKVLFMVQRESLLVENEGKLKTLQTFRDDQGIIRLKTKIIYRRDTEDFLKPVVLPSNHEVVRRLIYYVHEKNCHAGVQIILNLLRERYWILSGRKTVKYAVSKCITCQRYNSRKCETEISPLPENRVKDAAVFQVTGIDMAGPLYLKGNKKCWVLIFTCAVYRAVHLELVTSASTDAFLMAFRRFVARRGRCSTVYSDNGTNFVGAANALKQINWNKIQKQGTFNSIEWKFNPPTAAWWGGWWERLIRILKDLLKKVLGQACLNYEEMATVLTDCERVINSRPLTYVCEDESVRPLSPSMFLQEVLECEIPDLDAVERESLVKRIKYRQSLSECLKKRFRLEYLGALIQRPHMKSKNLTVALGDIVLIGSDNKKRINWPLGRITELIPGKDGNVRLVKVQTAQQEVLRPIQRIYPLEVSASNSKPFEGYPELHSKEKKIPNHDDSTSGELSSFSNYGRRIRIPERLGF